MRLLWECINKLESNCRVRAVLRMLRFVCKLQGPTMASRHFETVHISPPLRSIQVAAGSRSWISKGHSNSGALRLLYEILWIFLKCLTILYVLFDFMMQPLQLRWIKACQTMHDGMMCMSMYVRLFLWKDVYRRFFQVLEQSLTIKTKHNTPSNAKSTSWGR